MLYQLHITLSEIYTPNVWRRVAVPDHFSFYKLHKVIQKAFGWKDYHLFQFMDAERSLINFEPSANSFNIGIPDTEDINPVIEAKKIKLRDIIPHHTKIKYIYDFGDHWQHVITLEKTELTDSKHASLLGGEGACPPEDCGGPHGYEQLKIILSDPSHEEHDDMRTWAGLRKNQQWDAEHFDHEKISRRLLSI